MSSLNPYKVALKRSLLWGLLLAVVASAFALGRWSVNFDPLGFVPIYSDGLPVDRREDTFLAIVKDWQTYLLNNDGFIPEDPYRGLLATGPAWTFNSLREVYFAPYLPPRLNVNLSKNPRYVVFSYRPSFPSGESNWEYYADGSWAKVPVVNRSAVDAGSTDVDKWVHDFPKTGFCDWKVPGERDAWVAKNKNRLRWDEQLREYVVATQPAQ